MKNYVELKLNAGADGDFEVTIVDEDGAAIDLTAMFNTILILYYENETQLQKYSVLPSAGWVPMTIGGVDNNVLSFRLLSSDTTLAPKGIVLYEVRTQATDVGATDDSKYDSIVRDQYICTISPSLSSTLVLPT